MVDIKNHTPNLGPRHPAAHDVLRLVLEPDGGAIQCVDPHIGLLHCTTGKFAEQKIRIQSIPYMDRLDYTSMMVSEHAYVVAIKHLLGLGVPLCARYIHVMFDEITRIMSHLMWIGSRALNVGAVAVFLYASREREDLLNMYEVVSGVRMHAAYHCPGDTYRDLPGTIPQYKALKVRNKKALAALSEIRLGSLLSFIEDFTNRFLKHVDKYKTLLVNSRIWKQHLVGIGMVSPEHVLNKGSSDAMLRGSGIEWDMRKKQSYEMYDRTGFDTPVGVNGGCYDRYPVRVERIRQSSRIIRQCIKRLRKNPDPVTTDNHKVAPPSRVDMKTNMEELIHHFKLFIESMHASEGETHAVIEHPKDELGIYTTSDDANKPYRLKIHAPGLVRLVALDEMAKGYIIAGAVVVIGTQDIVLGEIDR